MRISDWSSDGCSSDLFRAINPGSTIAVQLLNFHFLADNALADLLHERRVLRVAGVAMRHCQLHHLEVPPQRRRSHAGVNHAPFVASWYDGWNLAEVAACHENAPFEATHGLVDRLEGVTRSEERRVGKECVITCKSWWS